MRVKGQRCGRCGKGAFYWKKPYVLGSEVTDKDIYLAPENAKAEMRNIGVPVVMICCQWCKKRVGERTALNPVSTANFMMGTGEFLDWALEENKKQEVPTHA